jgi:hypothetical protein
MVGKTALLVFRFGLFLVLLAPFLVSKQLLFPFVTTKSFVFRIVVELLLPVYAYLVCVRKDLRPSFKNPLTLVVVGFLIFNFISAIFGVNSSFTLRALAIRGLVEKVVSNEDNRKFIYKPTFDLLSFMGVSKVEDLPNYNEVNSNIKNTINELEEENKIENNG